MRIYLVVVDDSPESGIALRFAARRATKTGGGIEILCIVPEPEFIAFGGIQATLAADAHAQAEALVARVAGELFAESGVAPRITVREGDAPAAIRAAIAADPDIAALVLGAAASGTPGPLVSAFSGTDAGTLGVPIMIVPGSLSAEAIDRLS